MVTLITEGFKFRREMFVGGRKPAELVGLPTTVRANKKKNLRGQKGKTTGRQPAVLRRNKDDEASEEGSLDATRIENYIGVALKGLEEKLGDIVAAKVAENNKIVIESLTKWLSENKIVEEVEEDVNNNCSVDTVSDIQINANINGNTANAADRERSNEGSGNLEGNEVANPVAKPSSNGDLGKHMDESGGLEELVVGVAFYNSQQFMVRNFFICYELGYFL